MENKLKSCSLCGSIEDLIEIPIFGGENKNGNFMHWSGGIHICKKCYSEMQKCSTCNKKIKSERLINFFKSMNCDSLSFCRCEEEKEELRKYNEYLKTLEDENIEKKTKENTIYDCKNEENYAQQIFRKVREFFLVSKRDNYNLSIILIISYMLFVMIYAWDIEYGFFQFLKWVITILSVWTILKYKEKKQFKSFILFFYSFAIIFNPLFPLKFDEDFWGYILLFNFVFLCYWSIKNRNIID